jgi:hypothetical protein
MPGSDTTQAETWQFPLVLALHGDLGPREILEAARLSWRRRGIPVEEICAEPAAVISVAAELVSAGLAWCMLRLTDHPEWESAGFNRLEGVRAAHVHRVDGMNRALQTLRPQVLVAEGQSATLYEIIRYGADLWEAHRAMANKGPEVLGQKHLKGAAK